jgi:hypothetical protein
MQPLTYAQAWRDQDDLDALCRDRPLRTREIIGQNAHYGNDWVIKLYAGLRADEALRIALPHGLELMRNPHDEHVYRVLARMPVIAYYTADGVAPYRSLGVRNLLWPMAAPFVYAARMVARDTPEERRGTIFLPAHSIETHQPAQDFAELADRLSALTDAHQPITVCMYFRDFLSGRHEPFVARGLRVVSAGHVHDPQFLFRLRHLLVGHRFAASNELGSSCYMAIHAGCSYFHVRDSLAVGRKVERDDVGWATVLARLEQLSGRGHDEQSREADRYLGTANLLEPHELRELLSRAKQLDRWGVCVDRSARPLPLTVTRPWRPWLALRWLDAAGGPR